MKKSLNWNKNEDGYTLAAVLLIFIIVSILGMSIIALSVHAMKISAKEHDNQSTYYIAESGATYRLAQIEVLVDSATAETEAFLNADPNFAKDPITNEYNESEIAEKFFSYLDPKLVVLNDPDPANPSNKYDLFEDIKGESPRAELDLEFPPALVIGEVAKTYIIKSEGIIGEENRTVELPITIEWQPKPQYALLTRNDIEIRETGSHSNPPAPSVEGVQGNIGTLEGKIDFTTTSAGKVFKGDIFVKDPTAPDSVKYINGYNHVHEESAALNPLTEDSILQLSQVTELPNLPTFMPFPVPGFTPEPDINMPGSEAVPRVVHLTGDRHYDLIQMAGAGNELVFNVGNAKRIITVNDFKVNAGKLRVDSTDTGSLIIYVKNSFNAANTKIGLMNESAKINIYYAGTNDITLGDSGEMHASIYANDPNIKINLNAGAGIFGNILSRGTDVKLSAGTIGMGQLILAPNAKVTQTGGNFVGTVVADKYIMDGAGTMKFENVQIEGPFSIDGVMNDVENIGNSFMTREPPKPEPGRVTEK